MKRKCRGRGIVTEPYGFCGRKALSRPSFPSGVHVERPDLQWLRGGDAPHGLVRKAASLHEGASPRHHQGRQV